MTSRFVPGGTIAGDVAETTPGDDGRRAEAVGDRNAAEWEAVRKDLDEERRRREEARRANVEGGGERSLFEILQANKAAKQAAFEEQNRIRNQFRALDDDEIDFLHGVSDGRRAEEARVRRETEEGLAGFREKQRATTTTATADDGDEDNRGEDWGNPAHGRKRKRDREKEKGVLKGVKRRTSSGSKEKGEDALKGVGGEESAAVAVAAIPPPQTAVTAKPKPALGLVDYGSDEDDD